MRIRRKLHFNESHFAFHYRLFTYQPHKLSSSKITSFRVSCLISFYRKYNALLSFSSNPRWTSDMIVITSLRAIFMKAKVYHILRLTWGKKNGWIRDYPANSVRCSSTKHFSNCFREWNVYTRARLQHAIKYSEPSSRTNGWNSYREIEVLTSIVQNQLLDCVYLPRFFREIIRKSSLYFLFFFFHHGSLMEKIRNKKLNRAITLLIRRLNAK